MLEKNFDPKAIEEKRYAQWENSGAFACNPESNAKPFTVMMPPPNVTGSLHMGHALNMTLQDILTRYFRMKGRDALWQPGTDHAGIATQMVVERLLDSEGTNRRKLGREKFLQRVWEWKAQSGGTIVHQLRKLGTTPDWKRERFTMDEGLSKAVTKVFVQLYKEKLIYRDKRLVNWDPKLHTAISDLEVEQKEQKGHMWHIRYPIEGAEAEFITVATTRPETMLGDTAVAVHPEDERYKHLVGKFVALPITGRLIPIIADEYSDPEKGSGAVKITPAHDFNDFNVGKRHDLPMISIFDINAHIVTTDDSIPEAYRGLERYAARKKILAELEELELLDQVENVKNTLPYGDRSGVVIEPYLMDQWYCDAPTLAKPAIKAVETGQTRFVPKTWENTYYEWMRNIQPWCISRQLWWGHQIPAWFAPDGTIFVDETEEGAQAQADKHFGEKLKLKRDEDVLDTWFSSALWPFSTLGWPDDVPEVKRYYPGDVLVTGFDIIFFWVARMMMFGIHFMGDVPFKDVYIHALVRDAKGQKMSKSKGNVMDPLELTDKYGADALRFTMAAMAAQGRDIRLSEERIEGYKHFATKLWNATKFCEMNECKPEEDFDLNKVSHPLNKWIIHEVIKTTQEVEAALHEYKFNDAAHAIYSFVWGTFCDWHIEFTKETLENPNENPKEARAVIAWVLERIYTILNPFMPFITEELSEKYLHKEQLLLSSKWPDSKEDNKIKNLLASAVDDIERLKEFITAVRSIRSDLNIAPKQKIDLYIQDGNYLKTKHYFPEMKFKRLARLENVFWDNVPPGCVQIVVRDVTLGFSASNIVDLNKELERLRKDIKKLDDDILKVDQKLGNEQFVSNAPEEIIAEHKKRKEDAQFTRDRLCSALKQLEAA